MEKILKERLNYLVDKLEGFLFGDNTGLTQNQVQYFQSLFSTDSYLFSADLLKFFKQEIFVGFAFNLLFVWIIFFFLPLNFYMCWECNNVMTSWLIGLGLFNVIMIVPKVFLIRKLLRIEEATDIYIANYSLWMFFKSKVYQINMTMSRYIFCSYIIGIFMLVITNGEVLHCEKFYGLMTLLFGSFALRAAFGFLKFVQNFSESPQGIESPSNIFAGISNKEMCSLAIIKVKEYKKKYNRDDEDCPICYVKYNNEDELRVMECSGNHGFHKKCIDEWLVKSNKCPQCRMSVFEQREKNENNEMKEE